MTVTNEIKTLRWDPFFIQKKWIMGTTIVVALAAIAVGVAALQGIAGHNLGPFHALANIKPEGAWSLIGIGSSIILFNIVYGIKDFINYNNFIKKTHIPVIFESLDYWSSFSKDSSRELFCFTFDPCRQCAQATEEDPCTNSHRYVFFIIKNGQRQIFTFYGDDTALGTLLNERFINSKMQGAPLITKGINWACMDIHRYTEIKEPLTEELKVIISKEFKKLKTNHEPVKLLELNGISYILIAPREILIYDKGDSRIQQEMEKIASTGKNSKIV